MNDYNTKCCNSRMYLPDQLKPSTTIRHDEPSFEV